MILAAGSGDPDEGIIGRLAVLCRDEKATLLDLGIHQLLEQKKIGIREGA